MISIEKMLYDKDCSHPIDLYLSDMKIVIILN